MPLSRTRTTACSPSDATLTEMLPPASVYLDALLIRLERICANRVGSASTIAGSGASVTSICWRAASMSGRVVSQRTVDRCADVDALAHEAHPVLLDARNIEQIVEQTRQVRNLPVDHVARELRLLFARIRLAHDRDGAPDRVKRIPELVRKNGEEAILPRVDLGKLVVHVPRLVGHGLVLSHARLNARFERRLRLAQLRFDAAAFRHFRLERQLRRGELSRARDGQRLRHQHDERNRSRHRSGGRDRFHHAGEPVARLPQRPHLHPVRRAARDDEEAEQQKDPVERHVAPLADEVNQRDGNRKVSNPDQRVGNEMQADQRGVPHVAHAVRHEIARRDRAPHAAPDRHGRREQRRPHEVQRDPPPGGIGNTRLHFYLPHRPRRFYYQCVLPRHTREH